MPHPARKLGWMGRTLALLFCLAVTGFAAAQEDAATPAPPPDTASTLQQAAPESQIRAVRLSDVQGGVQILQNGDIAFQQAQLNMPVVEGMKLVTAEDGRAEVQFEDGSVARVTPNSSLTLTQLGRNEDGSTITVIEADTGLTYYELNGRAGQYTVRFGRDGVGQDKIAPNDSSIFRLDLDKPSAELAVTHGSVHISDDENLATDLHTNQSAQFDPQNPDEYQLVQSVTANTWDQWNSDRDEALAELDENETAARANTEEPDNPAWNDLDANGDWYDVPGQGMGWSPSGVGEDWDPYGLGAWGYYSGVGYTWISGYSWGWWPYHCGAWSWFDGFGWMWFPGNCGWRGIGFGGGWYPYGTIRNFPAGYRCPRRPARLPKRVHRPGRHPIDHPRHGPVRHNPRLIAVNRGAQFTQQFRSEGGAAPRVFHYGGENIAPVVATVRPMRGGPLGEGFSNVRRVDPGVGLRGAYGGSVYGGSGHSGSMVRRSVNAGRPAYLPGHQPSQGFGPQDHSAPAGGVRMPLRTPAFRPPPTRAPVFRPAPPVQRIPAFHPAPAPAFHPAPAPSFHPAPAGAGRGRH